MNNNKLNEIGEKLDISKKDIKKIKKEKQKRKIQFKINHIILYFLSIFFCFFCGINGFPLGNSYPFINTSFTIIAGFSIVRSKDKKFLKVNKILTIILSIIGFLIGFGMGQKVNELYSSVAEYGVYIKE